MEWVQSAVPQVLPVQVGFFLCQPYFRHSCTDPNPVQALVHHRQKTPGSSFIAGVGCIACGPSLKEWTALSCLDLIREGLISLGKWKCTWQWHKGKKVFSRPKEECQTQNHAGTCSRSWSVSLLELGRGENLHFQGWTILYFLKWRQGK